MTKKEMYSLKGNELIKSIVDFTIDQMRAKGEQKKKEVYNRLTINQKSLLSFWIMYGHTLAGWFQFYLEGIIVGGYDHYIPEIRKGLIHVGDRTIADIVAGSEKLYKQNRGFISEVWDKTEKHIALDEKKQINLNGLKIEFKEIDRLFLVTLDSTIKKIEMYILKYTDEYLAMANSIE